MGLEKVLKVMRISELDVGLEKELNVMRISEGEFRGFRNALFSMYFHIGEIIKK